MNLRVTGFEARNTEEQVTLCARRTDSLDEKETDCYLDAYDGRAPDAPARPKMAENVVINKREEHPPPPAEWQGGGDACKDLATEVPKTDGDLAAPDDKAPDAPARPDAAENDAPNENDQHPLLRAQEPHGCARPSVTSSACIVGTSTTRTPTSMAVGRRR